MSIVSSINQGIKQYGSKVKIVKDKDTIITTAFIEPLRYKNKMYINGESLPAGFFDGGHYLYIGLANITFDDDYRKVVIFCDNKGYIIKRAESYMAQNKILYVWAILMPYKRRMEDDYDSN